MDNTRLTVIDIDARRAERIADAIVSAGRDDLDREENGGRIVVCGRVAVYVCTDAYRVGNISRFGTAAEAIEWANGILDEFASA